MFVYVCMTLRIVDYKFLMPKPYKLIWELHLVVYANLENVSVYLTYKLQTFVYCNVLVL